MKKRELFTFIFFLFVFVLNAQVEKKTSQKTNTDIQSVESTSSITIYDFTTGSDKYFGGSTAAIEIEAGVWGMVAGDANHSGIVTSSDKDPINNELNSSGYYDSDTNMSGIVTSADKDFINANLNKSSQVPN